MNWLSGNNGLFPSGVLSLRMVVPFSLRCYNHLVNELQCQDPHCVVLPQMIITTGHCIPCSYTKLFNKAGLAHPSLLNYCLLNQHSCSHSPHKIQNVPLSVCECLLTTLSSKWFLSLLCHSHPACLCFPFRSDQTLAQFILFLYLLLCCSFQCLSV